MQHRSKEEWNKIIDDFQNSGLSITKFCKESGIPSSSFLHWYKRGNITQEIVCSRFSLDPRDKIIFAFCNNNRDRLKLLVWEDNVFWIHFKRIERGHVVWPTINDTEETMVLSIEDIKNIIITPGIIQKIKRQEVWRKA